LARDFTARDAAVIRSRKPTVVPEQTIRRPDVPDRQIRMRIAPVLDEAGDAKYLVTISEDLTEVRGLEQQLRQAQKLATVGQLTGGIAHDFNNLLGIMLGNLDLLSEHLEPGTDQAELATEATTAARRGAELTQRMLAFARKQPLQPRSIDI